MFCVLQCHKPAPLVSFTRPLPAPLASLVQQVKGGRQDIRYEDLIFFHLSFAIWYTKMEENNLREM